jgi:formylmethanofuran dehydrogenase subunit C
VSDAIVLRLRDGDTTPLAVEHLTADHLSTMSEREIAALPAWRGRQQCRLGDLFDVRGGAVARLRIEGSLDHVDGVGEGTSGGEMIIEGNGGNRVGMNMTGGIIEVTGNVGADAGVAMGGGRLHVRGSAGDRLGAMVPGAARGMSGGEIVVEGSAGADAACRMRRGLIVVGGRVGGSAARSMIAGSLIAVGRIADGAATGNKRGTIVAMGGIAIPPEYQYACTFSPPHLMLTVRYLRRAYGFVIEDHMGRAAFRRYCIAAGVPGKGEILEWTAA